MRRLFWTVLATAVGLAAVGACAAPVEQGPPPVSTWIVVLDPGAVPGLASPDAPEDVVAGVAEELLAVHKLTAGRIYARALQGFTVEGTAELAALLEGDPRVAWIEQDGPVEAWSSGTQVNPPWGLDRLDQQSRELDRRYHYGNDGWGVHVYVLDSGLRTSHVDFDGRASNDHDATGGSGTDLAGHGTAVASVVGGRRFGVAKAVRLHGVKVLDDQGRGTAAALLEGLDWVAGHGVRPGVVLTSLGCARRRSVDVATTVLMERGLVVVAAAGNGDQDVEGVSPAGVPGVIAVGAVSRDDRRWPMSNWGSQLIFAPGVSIPVAGVAHDAHADMHTGTSLAAAHVAGVAARCLERYPAADQLAVWRDALMRNSTVAVVRNAPHGLGPLVYSSFRAGVLERVADGVVEGWVWDPALPDQALEVDVLAHVAGLVETIATVRADAFRADLVSRGLGNGAHGFRFPLPEAWREREDLSISVNVSRAGFRLLDPTGMDHVAVGGAR